MYKEPVDASLRLHDGDQSVNAIYGNNLLCWELYKTRKCTVLQSAEFRKAALCFRVLNGLKNLNIEVWQSVWSASLL
jgi:hypothetical protein